MPTVRLRDAAEYPESGQKLFDLARRWFGYDFKQPAAMSRVWPGIRSSEHHTDAP